MCLSKSETIGLVNDQGAVEAVIQFEDILRCVRAARICVCMRVRACARACVCVFMCMRARF